MDRKLMLVFNPSAGQRRANRYLPEIIRTFWDAGYCVVTYVTAAMGDAAEYVAAHAAGYDRVVCVGGDGTLNETIAGMLRSEAALPIGYIPAGTTNDYASSIGLSSDVLRAARDAAEGELHSFDVGSFNGRYFSYTASCGAFTKASYSTPQPMKNMLGHLAYILEGIKDIPSIRSYRLRVETDDSVIEDDFIFCSITNSTSVGGILKLDAQMVALNDGEFEVMLVRTPTLPMQLSTIIHGLTSLDLPNEMVYFFKAKRISVDCAEPIEWTLDGERESGGLRAEMRNLHNAIRLVLPARAEATMPEGAEQ